MKLVTQLPVTMMSRKSLGQTQKVAFDITKLWLVECENTDRVRKNNTGY